MPRRWDGITLVHAENGGAIDYLDAVERRQGVTNESYLRSQPVELEPEGMNRTAVFAALTGCHLHFVHCTSAPGARMVGALKDSGGSVTTETQIHYLLLTNDEVLRRGPLGKVGPPLRDAEHLPRLWEALADGRIDHLSSDHSPKSMEVKLAAPNILDATFGGIAGTGVMLPLAFSEGFKKGRLTIERLAEGNFDQGGTDLRDLSAEGGLGGRLGCRPGGYPRGTAAGAPDPRHP